MDSLAKSRPVGITIITILIFLWSLLLVILGLYFVVAGQDAKTESEDLLSNIMLDMIIWNATGTIILGLVLCLIGIFLFLGKRWAKIVLGVVIWANILGGTSIPILIISLGIFIYLFFFKSAKEFFQSA